MNLRLMAYLSMFSKQPTHRTHVIWKSPAPSLLLLSFTLWKSSAEVLNITLCNNITFCCCCFTCSARLELSQRVCGGGDVLGSFSGLVPVAGGFADLHSWGAEAAACRPAADSWVFQVSQECMCAEHSQPGCDQVRNMAGGDDCPILSMHSDYLLPLFVVNRGLFSP